MYDFTIDDGDPDLDGSFLRAVEQELEMRDLTGKQPGRTARLDRLVEQGLLVRDNWFRVTEKGQQFLADQAAKDHSET